MNEEELSEKTADEAAYRPTFRFAGVELQPDDDPNDLSRKAVQGRVKGELWVNSIGSVLLGIAPLIVERWLATRGLTHVPSPYPWLSRGLPLFYVGWAMWWGVRDSVHASTMDERHPLNDFTDGVARLQWILGAGGVMIVCAASLIIYNLLGGGIYGLFKLIQKSKDDLKDVAPRA